MGRNSSERSVTVGISQDEASAPDRQVPTYQVIIVIKRLDVHVGDLQHPILKRLFSFFVCSPFSFVTTEVLRIVDEVVVASYS